MKEKEKSDWLQQLASALTNQPDEIPPGWKSRQQLEKELGVSEASLRRKLPILEAQGKVEKQAFRIIDRAGRSIKVPHWRVK